MSRARFVIRVKKRLTAVFRVLVKTKTVTTLRASQTSDAPKQLFQPAFPKTSSAVPREILEQINKGKVRPRTGHEGPEGEQRHTSILSLTSALDRSG